jgi:radical SAM superfamily enzyme YgiQ (UPF0313 family)
MKITFIHAPNRVFNDGRLVRFRVMNVAQGVFTLAAALRERGHETEIIHLGLEQLADPEFSLETLLKSDPPDIAGISLQWALSVNEAIEAAEEAKRAVPDVRVVFGGITASGWDRELMDACGAADFVIRGDAEKPLPRLIDAIAG